MAKMTMKAAIANYLLKGRVLTIMTGFQDLNVTNVPREVSRLIERPFGVIVSRTRRQIVTQYGEPGCYYEYRLNNTDYNAEGIQKMKEYVAKYIPEKKKLDPLSKSCSQTKLFEY